jgi:diguanylate cyclase (GGDEF)-like protein
LYNRRYFFEVAQTLYANASRQNLSLAVAMLDIDFFKKTNDTYGHKAGDAALQHIAWFLKERFRKTDLVARFGGEEFCILTCNIEPERILKIFDDVRAMIAQLEIPVDHHTLRVTVSIGICTQLKPSLELMINEADARLYEAKNQGRNRVICS